MTLVIRPSRQARVMHALERACVDAAYSFRLG